MDVLVMARNELRRSAVLTPPASYRDRLICQMVLASILVIQCSIYLVIWVRDARRAGKGLNIFRIQRTQGGSMITIQALCAYIICTLITGIVMMVHRAQLYMRYYANGIPKHMGAVHLMYMTTTSFGTLAYTFANFNSTLLILRRSAGPSSTSRTWLWIYNASFLISILGWLAAVIYIGVDLNPGLYKLYYTAKTALVTIETILDDPTKLTADMIGPLMSLEQVLPQTGALVMKKCKEMIMLAIIYSTFYALAGAFGLLFVWTLREHTRESRSWIYRSFHVMSLVGTSSQSSAGTAATSESGNTQDTAVAKSKTSTKQPIVHNKQHAALERLVSDLTLSVPVVLLLSLYYPIAGAVAIAHISKSSWPNEEFQNDIFAWPTITMNNVIVAFFIYNSWKSPERYGAGNDRDEVVPVPATPHAHAHVLGYASAKQQQQKQHKRDSSVQIHELKTLHIVSSEKYDRILQAQKEEKELPTLPMSMDIENGYDRESQRDIEVLDNGRWV